MERTGWQRTWVRVLTTVLTVAVMILIFFFSMETADRSDQTSGKISMEVIRITVPEYHRKPPAERHSIYDKVQHIVRKAAHFTEYTILGLMLRFCLESWFGHRKRKWMLPLFSWTLGTLYAGTDELHQLLIDGRSGQWTDVALDSCGVLTGAIIATLILILICRHIKDARGKEA